MKKEYFVFVTTDSGLVLCCDKAYFPNINHWLPFSICFDGAQDVYSTNQDWCEDTDMVWHWLRVSNSHKDDIRLAPIDSIDSPIELLGYIVESLMP